MSADDPIKLLIVEGNGESVNERIRAQAGRVYADVYASVLSALDTGVRCQVVHPSERSAGSLFTGLNLAEIDGVVWTGSSMSIEDASPEVEAHLTLFRLLFEAGLPIFGSCWGLQVMAAALGGSVRRNPLGREIGIARNLRLTDAGISHPMFAGKPALFDSIATHVDKVERLPEEGSLLATNAACPVQAVAIDDGRRSFWGVQYHPEFDLEVLALCIRRNEAALISEGYFETSVELDAVCSSLGQIHRDPRSHAARQSVYGVSESVSDPGTRRLEIANWLETMVRPRAEHRLGRAHSRANS